MSKPSGLENGTNPSEGEEFGISLGEDRKGESSFESDGSTPERESVTEVDLDGITVEVSAAEQEFLEEVAQIVFGTESIQVTDEEIDSYLEQLGTFAKRDFPDDSVYESAVNKFLDASAILSGRERMTTVTDGGMIRGEDGSTKVVDTEIFLSGAQDGRPPEELMIVQSEAGDTFLETTRGRIGIMQSYLEDFRDLRRGKTQYALPTAMEIQMRLRSITEETVSRVSESIKASAYVSETAYGCKGAHSITQSLERDVEPAYRTLQATVAEMVDSSISDIQLAGGRLFAELAISTERASKGETVFRDGGYWGVSIDFVPGDSAINSSEVMLRHRDVESDDDQSWNFRIVVNIDYFRELSQIERQRVLAHETRHIFDLCEKSLSAGDNSAQSQVEIIADTMVNPGEKVKLEAAAILQDMHIFEEYQQLNPGSEIDDVAIIRKETQRIANIITRKYGVNGFFYVARILGAIHVRFPGYNINQMNDVLLATLRRFGVLDKYG